MARSRLLGALATGLDYGGQLIQENAERNRLGAERDRERQDQLDYRSQMLNRSDREYQYRMDEDRRNREAETERAIYAMMAANAQKEQDPKDVLGRRFLGGHPMSPEELKYIGAYVSQNGEDGGLSDSQELMRAEKRKQADLNRFGSRLGGYALQHDRYNRAELDYAEPSDILAGTRGMNLTPEMAATRDSMEVAYGSAALDLPEAYESISDRRTLPRLGAGAMLSAHSEQPTMPMSRSTNPGRGVLANPMQQTQQTITPEEAREELERRRLARQQGM